MLTIERVQIDLTRYFGCLLPCWFCESRRYLQRAGLVNLTQVSVSSCSGACLPPELCLSRLSKHKNHPHTGFLHPSNHMLQPLCFPSSNGSTASLQVPCKGTGLQTPLSDCLGVKSLFLCTREVSGGNTCSWQELSGRLKCDGPCAFREFSVCPTNTYPYSLLLILNISGSQLVLSKKYPSAKRLSRVSLIQRD